MTNGLPKQLDLCRRITAVYCVPSVWAKCSLFMNTSHTCAVLRTCVCACVCLCVWLYSFDVLRVCYCSCVSGEGGREEELRKGEERRDWEK